MNKNATIVITGAAGFIASCLTGYLNEQGYENLLLVDEFEREDKELNLLQKKYIARIEREGFFELQLETGNWKPETGNRRRRPSRHPRPSLVQPYPI